MHSFRCRQFRWDIDLYIDSHYAGFQRIELIEEYFEEYKAEATKLAMNIPWEYVILYAVFQYDYPGERMISADFLTLEMPYYVYVDLVRKRCDSSRFFFVRGRKGNDEY